MVDGGGGAGIENTIVFVGACVGEPGGGVTVTVNVTVVP